MSLCQACRVLWQRTFVTSLKASSSLSNLPDHFIRYKEQDEERTLRDADTIFSGLPVTADLHDKVEQQRLNKEAFQDALTIYLQRHGTTRRGHVEFIQSGLKQMEVYGVHRDIDTYRRLLELFPKHKMATKSNLMADFNYYPKNQDCCREILYYMNKHGVMPDDAIGQQIMAIFGDNSGAYEMYRRIMYWMPKRRYEDPRVAMAEVANYPTTDPRLIARLLLRRMCHDTLTEVTLYQLPRLTDMELSDEAFSRGITTADLSRVQAEEAVKEARGIPCRTVLLPDEGSLESAGGWITCARAPEQKRLLATHDEKQPLYVDGPIPVWYGRRRLSYFSLSTDSQSAVHHKMREKFLSDSAEEFKVRSALRYKDMGNFWENWTVSGEESTQMMRVPSVHEQSDSILLALCVFGPDCGEHRHKNTILRQLAATWIRGLLQEEDEAAETLARCQVVVRLSNPEEDTT